MTSQELQKKKLPDTPGVYFFVDSNKKILYIGKATSLRDRVRSYFLNDLIETRGRLIVDMVALAHDVQHTQTDSVLEALMLEANLIRTHLPKYNTKEKDNKSYNYVVVSKERFPKISVMRGRTLLVNNTEHSTYYGPFPHGAQLREAMKIIRRIFPYRDTKCVPAEDQIKTGRTPRPCFNRQIGLCPGVCTGEISKEEYGMVVKNLKLFFEGKKKAVIKNLEQQMADFARRQEFEKAGGVRQTIFALNHIHDIALLKKTNKIDESAGGIVQDSAKHGVFRIEAYDVAHSSGTNVVGVMTVIEDGELAKSEYRKFKIKLNPGVNDTGALKEILRRRLGHAEWPLPNLIVLDGAQAQINVATEVLKERGFNIELVSVVKDERHKPREVIGKQSTISVRGREILLANHEAHRFAITYHRLKRDRII